MFSCNFCPSTSKVLSSPTIPPAAFDELLDLLAFLELALYLELSLDLVLSVELELERDDSEIERDGCFKGSLLVKASFPSSKFC